ncbi:MAG TPA: hypothetical protein VF898_07060 [Chloroflexota bacterium]
MTRFFIRPLLVAAIVPGLLLGTSTVRGQTSPTPTPRATSGVPSGHDLLTRMLAAVKHAGGARFTLTTKLHSSGALVTERFSGDLSWKVPSMKVSGTATSTNLGSKSPKTTTQTVQVLATGVKAATRTNTAQWQCTTVSAATEFVLFAPFLGSDAQSAYDEGSTKIDGVSTWHVLTVTQDPFYQTAKPVAIDLYLDRSTMDVVRAHIAETVSQGGSGSTVSVRADYSRYGEKVTVRLPGTCGASK